MDKQTLFIEKEIVGSGKSLLIKLQYKSILIMADFPNLIWPGRIEVFFFVRRQKYLNNSKNFIFSTDNRILHKPFTSMSSQIHRDLRAKTLFICKQRSNYMWQTMNIEVLQQPPSKILSQQQHDPQMHQD